MATSSVYSPMDVGGMVALVTGAGSGIGEAVATRLSELGCKVVLAGRRERELQRVRSALQQRFAGAQVHCAALDVRDVKAVMRLPDELPDGFRTVDILVINAGLAIGVAAAHEADMQDVETMVSTNVVGAAATFRAFVPGMVERGRGHVVMMSSIAAHEHYGGGSGYCASKAAASAFTWSARHDLVHTPVRVTSISPGMVKTEGFSMTRFKGDRDKFDAVYEGLDPLTAEDVADNVAYAVTRPARVQIADMIVFHTTQSGAKTVHRSKL